MLRNAFPEILWILFLVLFWLHLLPAQTPGERLRNFSRGEIRGRVLDAESGQPIEYANIVLYRQRDSVQVTGTITDAEGRFVLSALRAGRYLVEISFLGYHLARMEDVRITPRAPVVDLGNILLHARPLSGEEVAVEAERPPVTFQIDKKVIDVAGQLTTTSGTAVDVLENVPSVTVDIEGNVLLRGSGNFTLLIDGRLSILDPSEALQQIPASSIERIEIITNPSARYNPEGTAGIIHILRKKGNRTGLNGLASLDTGTDDKYAADLLLDLGKKSTRLMLGGNFNRRFFPGNSKENRTISLQDGATRIQSVGDMRRGRQGYEIRSAVTWKPHPLRSLQINLRAGHRGFQMDSRTQYQQTTTPGNEVVEYLSIGDRSREGPFYSVSLDFQNQLSRPRGKWTARLVFDHREGDENTLSELRSAEGQVASGTRTYEKGPFRRWQLETDLIYPWNPAVRMETGFHARLLEAEDHTGLWVFDSLSSQYREMEDFRRTTRYLRNIYALYGLLALEGKWAGLQLGLRGEYTDRSVELVGSPQTFRIDRVDWFPSLHLSLKSRKGHQMMASYTRRINRPRGWYLEPFETWMDAYNVRTGNPDLQPEYMDSFELGVQGFWGRRVLSLETYYRTVHNKIERVRSLYPPDPENVTLRTLANVGQSEALGTELLVNTDLLKGWNLNAMANLYNYRVKGVLLGERFQRSSFTWNLRLNNTFRPSPNTRIQANLRYNSPSTTAQGRTEGFATLDLAVRHDLIPNRLSATLQVRDLFSSTRREYTSTGPGFTTHTLFQQKTPIFFLNLRYTINQFKQTRLPGEERNGGDEDEF